MGKTYAGEQDAQIAQAITINMSADSNKIPFKFIKKTHGVTVIEGGRKHETYFESTEKN